MYVKCKPEKVDETIKKIRDLAVGGDLSVTGVTMSEKIWTEMFGSSQYKKLEMSGVPVTLTDSGRFAEIGLGSLYPIEKAFRTLVEPPKKTAKKTSPKKKAKK